MERCPRCDKAPPLCVCAGITPLPTKHRVLILQHPQEPREPLGTARLAALTLKNSTLKVGLSWRNLSAALGAEAQPSRWAAIYLGSEAPAQKPLAILDKKGDPIGLPPWDLDGIIVLDGTWSQAKTLWWRNAWLLKCRRGVITPPRPSLYGKRRKEPRRECLSTLESIGLCLTAMGEDPAVEGALLANFRALLAAVDAQGRVSDPPRSPPSPE